MSARKPKSEGAELDHQMVRTWLESDDLARRIEEAAKQRARLKASRGTSGNVRDNHHSEPKRQVHGYHREVAESPVPYARQSEGEEACNAVSFDTRLEQARIQREEILARREQEEVPSGETGALPDGASLAADTADADCDGGRLHRDIEPGDEVGLLPPMVADTFRTNADGGEKTERRRVRCPRLALGTGTGVAAGLGVCGLAFAAIAYWDSAPPRLSVTAQMPPEAVQNLTGLEWMASTPEPPRPSDQPEDAVPAGVPMRSAANDLVPPGPLAEVPDMSSKSPETRGDGLSSDTRSVEMPASPSGRADNGKPLTARSWASPARDQPKPRLVPTAADAPPRIETGRAFPAIARVPATPVSPARAPGELRMAGLGRIGSDPDVNRAWSVAALPEAAGLDPDPAIPAAGSASRVSPQTRVAIPASYPQEMSATPLAPPSYHPPRRPPASASLYLPPSEGVFDVPKVNTAQAPLRAIVTTSTGHARLDALGIEITQIQVSPFPVASTRVHYFHAEDAGNAVDLTDDLGGDAVDMTGIKPTPPRGPLEIQLAD